MLTVPDPEPGEPALRPAAPMTSIQHFEAPSDATVVLPGAPDQAGEAEPMPEQRAAKPERAQDDEQVRAAAARVRPAAPEGAERPARADIQTTAGVPKKPIPEESADEPTMVLPPSKPDNPEPQVEGEGGKSRPQVQAESDADKTVVIRLPERKTDEDPDQTAIIRTTAPRNPGPSPEDTVVIPGPVKKAPAAGSPPAKAQPARDPGEDTVVLRPRADDTMVLPSSTVAPPTDVVTAIIPVLPGGAGKAAKPVETPAPANPGRVPKPARPRREPLDLGHAPAVLTISALGVLMVALAYAGGRVSTGNAPYAYWLGQVVVFTPVVIRLLSRRMAGTAESFLLVMGLALNQYLLKWMYSPDQFRFPDELQHWLATTIITESGELFQPNPALPPAVHFPGLAEMGAAVTSMTGLPVTAAGVIVAGVAHLVFVAVLFAAVLRASNSPAVAGVCCATYATALHYLFFNSMFLYQTAALPFFMLTIWATRRWRAEGGWPFVTLAVCSAALTTVSHHVTAFALVITLLLLAVVELAVQKPRRWAALIMPAVALVVVATWMLTVARDVLGYLEAPVEQVGQTISNLFSGRSEASSTTAAVSVGQLLVQGTGLLGLFVLYAALVRDMIHRRDRDSWRWAAVVGGAVFFAGNGVRFLGQNGPEIAGRLSTFTYVPISILAAIALVRGVQIIPAKDADGHRWRAAAPAIDFIHPGGWNLYSRVAAGSAMITLLMVGARAGGWPPLGSILPGPYLAGGFERSVDAYGVHTADWERRTLGPGNRIGGDVTSVSLASTYGRQDPVREVGPLYYADDWGLEEDQFVSDLAIQYLVVDKRLSEQLPEGEAYFENDPNAGSITRPLTTTQIAKFDSLTDVDRLYDNGTVRVYRMGVQ
ncbi:hypothetical protein [Actinoplanes sp. NPDC049681]|uniref:hypothetical protein n=1 Tax=Actinoplanes sp. NPDC049681 TaxID=3363905 RepID=UPI0037A59327